LTSNQVVGGSNPSGRAFRFNKLAVKLFLSLCHSVPFAGAKVFDLTWTRDFEWAELSCYERVDRDRPVTDIR